MFVASLSLRAFGAAPLREWFPGGGFSPPMVRVLVRGDVQAGCDDVLGPPVLGGCRRPRLRRRDRHSGADGVESTLRLDPVLHHVGRLGPRPALPGRLRARKGLQHENRQHQPAQTDGILRQGSAVQCHGENNKVTLKLTCSNSNILLTWKY